jgi:hypothetical protein
MVFYCGAAGRDFAISAVRMVRWMRATSDAARMVEKGPFPPIFPNCPRKVEQRACLVKGGVAKRRLICPQAGQNNLDKQLNL